MGVLFVLGRGRIYSRDFAIFTQKLLGQDDNLPTFHMR